MVINDRLKRVTIKNKLKTITVKKETETVSKHEHTINLKEQVPLRLFMPLGSCVGSSN